MSIQGNLSNGTIDLLATASGDTVLFDKTVRTTITAMSIFNTTGADRELEIYRSPDLTSANGTLIATYTLGFTAADNSADVGELIGQGLTADENIIGVQITGAAALADINCSITYTQYTGGS